MRDYIILNNKNSNEIKGLLIQNLPPITKPRIRAEIEEIDGRDGDIVTPLGYGAYDKVFSIGLYGDFDINEVIKYFDSEGIVVFSNEPNKYYNYKILEQIDFEKLIRFRTADVMMHVQPFKYSTTEGKETEEMETKTASGSEIDLPDTNNEKLQMEKLKGDTHQDTIDAEEGNENEDTNLAVNDVDPSKENYITLKGNTSQDQHESQNLLQITAPATQEFYGITITNNGDGTITLNGTATNLIQLYLPNLDMTTHYLAIKKDTDYFLNGCMAGGSLNTYNFIIEGTTWYADTGNGVQFNSHSDDAVHAYLSIARGVTLDNAIFKPMLVEGTEAQEFEPYGKVTPSPQYPSEVKVVTGENVVRVSGKNLANFPENVEVKDYPHTLLLDLGEDKTIDAITVSLIVDNLIFENQSTNGAILDFRKADNTHQYLIPGQIHNSDHVGLGGRGKVNTGTYSIVKENITFRYLWYMRHNGATQGTMSIQAEYGSTPTDFAPYLNKEHPISLGTLELCKIGDYKDYLFKRNGKWYKHKEIGKYEFDENTNFVQNWNGNTDNKTYCMYCVLGTNFGRDAIAISNILPYVSSIYAYDKIGIYQEKNSGGRIIFRVPKTIANSVSEFKTWLASNSMIVYTLIAPTEEEITDTSLIAQLDALHTAELQETSYINSTPAKEYPYINLKYNVVTPAPSPDRASEINKVTGNNVVSVSGKNLFDSANVEQGKISSAGVISGDTTRIRTNEILYLNAGTYTISFDTPTNVNYHIYSTGGVWEKLGNTSWQTSPYTFTLTERKGIKFVFRNIGDSAITPSDLTNCQLEEGSTATDYVPYSKTDYPINLGTLELCKIGDYQDYLYKNNGKWYVHKEIGKVVLDGSEQMNFQGSASTPTERTIYRWYLPTYAQTDNYLSNKFIKGSSTSNRIVIVSGNDRPYISIDNLLAEINVEDDNNTKLAKFKTWLSNNNVTLYYVLATPTEEEITDETLLTQLDALDNIYNQKGLTKIKTNPEVNNMPLSLDVSYTESKPITITNSGNIYSKPIFTIYGEGNIGVYLNDIQLFDINLGSEEQITIDVAEMQAYNKETKALKNRLVTGNYDNFVLKVGENKISFSGIVKKFEIENYSRWI